MKIRVTHSEALIMTMIDSEVPLRAMFDLPPILGSALVHSCDEWHGRLRGFR